MGVASDITRLGYGLRKLSRFLRGKKLRQFAVHAASGVSVQIKPSCVSHAGVISTDFRQVVVATALASVRAL